MTGNPRSGIQALFVLASVALSLAGCGASPPRAGHTNAGQLGVGAGSRLFFEADGEGGHGDVTVAVNEVEPRFSFELSCGHVAPGRPLQHPTTGSINGRAMAEGREVYSITHCDLLRERDGDALPLFIVSHRVATALDHRERTMVRREHQESDLALMPVGHETLRVRVDGRMVDVDTVHATGDGLELWIAQGATPIVVRMRDQDHVFTLAEVDTGSS
jgi:hypothetical protein